MSKIINRYLSGKVQSDNYNLNLHSNQWRQFLVCKKMTERNMLTDSFQKFKSIKIGKISLDLLNAKR